MNAQVEKGIYTWYGVRVQNVVPGFHLQFVDDTLLAGVKS